MHNGPEHRRERAKRARRRAFDLAQHARRYPRTKHKRRPLRPERLHPYSAGFHDYLQRHRPDLLAGAFNVLGYEHAEFDLEIEIPHPRQGKPHGRLRLPAEPIQLWMNYGVELSITYDQWHTHMGMGRTPEDPNADYAECVQLIEEIQREQRVFVYGYEEGRLGRSGVICADDLEADIRSEQELGHHSALLIRSWNGTYDRRLTLRS